MNGNCPECGEFLGKKRSCECGYGKSLHDRNDHQCAWVNETSGWRCRMRGGISRNTTGQSPWYCHWHYVSLHDPKWAEDYKEFVGWRYNIEKEYPKMQLLPIEKIWWSLSGKT